MSQHPTYPVLPQYVSTPHIPCPSTVCLNTPHTLSFHSMSQHPTYPVLPQYVSTPHIPCPSTVCLNTPHTLSFHTKKLWDSVNTKVNPCDNFYEFACGSWLEFTNIPAHEDSIGQHDVAKDRLKEVAQEILFNAGSSDSAALRKAARFYNSCMDSDAIQRRGVQPLRTLLRELGGWPMIDTTWRADHFYLNTTLMKLEHMGIPPLFTMFLTPDSRNPHTQALAVAQSFSFTLKTRGAYSSSRTAAKLDAMKTAARAVVAKMGGQTSVKEKDIDDMVNFEVQLVELLYEHSRPEEKTLQEMDAEFPMIGWSSYFRGLFQNDEVGIDIPDNELVTNYAPGYFRKLKDFLKKEDMKTVANYLMWRVVLEHLEHLSLEYRQIYLNFQTVLDGQTALKEKDSECTELSMEKFSQVLGNKYVTEYLQSSTKAESGGVSDVTEWKCF
ncbi:hypothetical protein ACOMHN_067049 [Nucella lapillus]